MKKIFYFFNVIVFSTLFLLSCSSDDMTSNENNSENTEEEEQISSLEGDFKILSLGDSYSIGQSVCETCRFPEQLKSELEVNYPLSTFQLQVIAQTGWTTTNLINAINSENPDNDFDIVTLLIGVNNQYQNKPFSLYEEEFPFLVNKAIEKAKGNKDNVIVISIPDYAYTPFGNGNQTITLEINTYNDFAEEYCNQNNISYVYITDITRQGLMDPNLVASDGLHPSELAYSKFVERILPIAAEKIQ
ncbi:MAG: SGNH/GDSL hydrolase family protein [Flavobacteriaceae bacterium]|nr:SGNH/GDSL hydrolase family protein [Flavobacteriaceae bacterium]